MAWSTREIAELAGTSLRAVRHYHQIGLLAEPDRHNNGYKQYGAAHLVRLVRIKRLTDLGFSLPQIAAMGDSDEHPEEALRALDDELAAKMERIRSARAELAALLDDSSHIDLPSNFVRPDAVAKLSDVDRSLVVVMTRVLGPRGLADYGKLLENVPEEPAGVLAFDDLPADADESTRREIVEHLVPYLRAVYAAHPGVLESRADAPKGPSHFDRTVAAAMSELYNDAQLDVLRRTREILRATDDGSGTG
ncbi:helix-turn-helix domain-containing protein [Mycolicibacterium lacusdiani]|uniref:helix-turn-helix domain-containing protein n=1 Tax=Mycolicibacterium lacusdiani TaxID=2895283 RepID=UPI001F00AB16|nr:MerR family transcriptional regulator [Mycolicibacterium lacusdiani]